MHMREFITIGEIAKLMNVSTHQIRYFEEKKILLANYIDQNEYRMYGVDEIYILAHILLLRKLNISVADIKKCFDDFSKSDYLLTLTQSVESMDEQINALIALRDTTKKIINESNSNVEVLNKFQVNFIKERNLYQLTKTDINSKITAKEIYEQFYNVSKITNLFEQDVISLYDDKYAHFCTEVKKNSQQTITYTLVEGNYLCYQFNAIDESCFRNSVSEFYAYAKKQSLNLCGNLIAIENSMLSTFFKDGLHFQLQTLIN